MSAGVQGGTGTNETRLKFCEAVLGKVRPQDHNQVACFRKKRFVAAEYFPENPFPPVAHHRISNAPTGDDSATAADRTRLSGAELQDKRPAVQAPSIRTDGKEFCLLAQAAGNRQTHGLHAGASNQADKR